MEKKKEFNPKVQWAKFIVVLILYLLFLYWVKSWWGLLVIPFIYDIYITKKIKWQWWKEAEKPVKFVMSWVDALVFALVAVYFINQFFFQNYVIPSSSLEKSLLTGDYLFVSKVSYGPRIPQTPLTMPLTQHTLPVVECKSYIEWPHWDYRRVKGLGEVQLNDIVVFNFPAGDTLCSAPQYQAYDYYQMCYSIGYQLYPNRPDPDSLSAEDRIRYFDAIYAAGRAELWRNRAEYGEIITRPADRRENYVKRCVGLPGQTLQIRNRIVYLDGKPNKEPENVQYTYYVKLKQAIPDELMQDLGISMEDLTSLNTMGYMPLTKRALTMLQAHKEIVESVKLNTDASDLEIYPLNGNKHWTRDNYGPVWIPKRANPSHLHSTISPFTSVLSKSMRVMTSRFVMVVSTSMARRPGAIPSRWTTTGCRATIATTLPTPAIGASCLRTISWVSRFSSGGRAIQTVVDSVVSVGAVLAALLTISSKQAPWRCC